MRSVFPILYIVGLYGAYLAGSLDHRAQSTKAERKFPYTTFAVTLLIAISSLLQLFFPAILPAFERDYAQFLTGEWWRLVTSLFVQDGGLGGAIFNLLGLALVGYVAEQSWTSRQWLLLFFGGGILSQFAGFLWQPVGAGNSVANFSLAASLAVFYLLHSKMPAVRIAALLALIAGVVLLFLKDIHGAAMLIGAGLTLLLLRLYRSNGSLL